MRSRGLVVILALILATIATAGVFLYSRGVKEEAIAGGDLRGVIVAKVDVAANTNLDQLLSEGGFEIIQVPANAVVAGAVTDLSQLRGRTTSAYVFAGEQIPESRIQGGLIPGGVLGIPEGHQAISVALGGPRAIAGALAGGDRITIYATFEGISLLLLDKNFLKKANDPSQLASLSQADVPVFDTTVVLVPEVEVLRVAQTLTEDGTVSDPSGGDITLTLAFLPDEAQQFVFALEKGRVYLSLLPPDEAGVDLAPLTVAQLFLPEKTK